MRVGNPLGHLLGRSPLKPLQKHMQTVGHTVACLPALGSALQSQDWESAAGQHKEILTLAAQADQLKLELRTELRRSMFMPVSRSDLLELLTAQDLVADHAESFAGLVMSRKLRWPSKCFPAFAKYLDSVIQTVEAAQFTVSELDEVFEVGFAQREIDEVYARLKTLGKQERTARKLEAKLRGGLMREERSLEPLNAMFLYKAIDKLDDIARGAERIGNRLLIMISV